MPVMILEPKGPRPRDTDPCKNAGFGVKSNGGEGETMKQTKPKPLKTQPERRWKNRIVGHGEVDSEQLLANPKNWRIHPKNQRDALVGVLSEIGWVQDVIVNKQTGFVVVGHARVALAIKAGERVPVVYVDLTEKEEGADHRHAGPAERDGGHRRGSAGHASGGAGG